MSNSQDTTRNIIGMILIGVGGLFLLAQGTDFNIFGLGWPLFVLIPGAIFLTIALRAENEETVGLIFPGVIVTGTGVILAYQNFTGHWESWAYVWTLYPVFVGIAMRHMGYRTDSFDLRRTGQMMMIVGMIAFVSFGALFELFIFNGGSFGILAPIAPVVMIGAGLFLVLRNARSTSKTKRKAHDV